MAARIIPCRRMLTAMSLRPKAVIICSAPRPGGTICTSGMCNRSAIRSQQRRSSKLPDPISCIGTNSTAPPFSCQKRSSARARLCSRSAWVSSLPQERGATANSGRGRLEIVLFRSGGRSIRLTSQAGSPTTKASAMPSDSSSARSWLVRTVNAEETSANASTQRGEPGLRKGPTPTPQAKTGLPAAAPARAGPR